MPLRFKAEAAFEGGKLRVRLTEIRLEGEWRILDYRGTFRLGEEGLELRVSAGSILRGIMGGVGSQGGLEGLLQLVAELAGVRVILRGPLGVKLAEFKPKPVG